MSAVLLRALGALLAASIAAPASAAVLYRSVSPEGTVQFSDIPPEKAQRVERLEYPDSGGRPPSLASGASREEQLRDMDAAVARASAQVDLAEHALALARRPLWGDDPLRFGGARRTRADIERVEFYQKGVRIARQTLTDVLREKRNADVQILTASLTPPIARQ